MKRDDTKELRALFNTAPLSSYIHIDTAVCKAVVYIDTITEEANTQVLMLTARVKDLDAMLELEANKSMVLTQRIAELLKIGTSDVYHVDSNAYFTQDTSNVLGEK